MTPDLSVLDALQNGGRCVFLLGEPHCEEGLEQTYDVLAQFQPDAVSVEEGIAPPVRSARLMDLLVQAVHDSSGTWPPDKTILTSLKKGLKTECFSLSPMILVSLYALMTGAPLYLTDIGSYFMSGLLEDRIVLGDGKRMWSRCETGSEADQSLVDLSLTEEEYVCRMRELIEELFGEGSCQKTLKFVKENEPFWTFGREYHHLHIGPEGMALRNEIMASSINRIPQRRILHVGGSAHFSDYDYLDKYEESLQDYTPLDHLIIADRKWYLNLPKDIWGECPGEISLTIVDVTVSYRLSLPDFKMPPALYVGGRDDSKVLNVGL